MITIRFLANIAQIILFTCSGTLNMMAYYKTRHVRELQIGVLMFVYCINSMIVFMSEFLKEPHLDKAYHVLNYFGVKAVCGIAISVLYLCLTSNFLEKKIGFIHAVIMMPLLSITVYIGGLNASVLQHWLFYAIRQVYLAGFVVYYYTRYACLKDKEYQKRIGEYRPLYLIGGIFAILVLVEDSIVIFNFPYVINTLNLKVFTEHNVSEDIFFSILAVIGLKHAISELIQRIDSAGVMEKGAKEKEQKLEVEPFITAYKLSSRQQDVLFLLIQDSTYKQMEEKLGLRIGTIKSHAHEIYVKTNSKNKRELIQKYKEFYEHTRSKYH